MKQSSEKLSFEAYTQLGSKALVQGNNEEAIRNFKLATKHYKDNATAWKQLGMAELAISTRTFCGSYVDKKAEEKEQNYYQKQAGKHLSKAKKLCMKGGFEYDTILQLQMHNCADPNSFQKMENILADKNLDISFTKKSKYNRYQNKLQKSGSSYYPVATKLSISTYFEEYQQQKTKTEQSNDNYLNTSNTVLYNEPQKSNQIQMEENNNQLPLSKWNDTFDIPVSEYHSTEDSLDKQPSLEAPQPNIDNPMSNTSNIEFYEQKKPNQIQMEEINNQPPLSKWDDIFDIPVSDSHSTEDSLDKQPSLEVPQPHAAPPPLDLGNNQRLAFNPETINGHSDMQPNPEVNLQPTLEELYHRPPELHNQPSLLENNNQGHVPPMQPPHVLELFNPQPNILPQPLIQQDLQPNDMRELYNTGNNGDGILPFNPDEHNQVVDQQLSVLQQMLDPQPNNTWQQRVSEKHHDQQGKGGQSRN